MPQASLYSAAISGKDSSQRRSGPSRTRRELTCQRSREDVLVRDMGRLARARELRGQ